MPKAPDERKIKSLQKRLKDSATLEKKEAGVWDEPKEKQPDLKKMKKAFDEMGKVLDDLAKIAKS